MAPPKKHHGKQQTLFSMWKGGNAATESEKSGGSESSDKSKLKETTTMTTEESSTATGKLNVNVTAEDLGNERNVNDNVNLMDVDVTETVTEKTDKPSEASRKESGKRDDKPAKKQYHFQQVWKVGNPWLRYDASKKQMFCTVCEDFDRSGKKNSFKTGCASMRPSNVNSHKASQQHQIAIAAYDVSKLEKKDKPMEKQICKLNERDMNRMKIYFSTSFYIAQKNKAYSDFHDLIGLQVHNFGKTEDQYKYQTYRTDKKCREFIDYIAADILETKLRKYVESDTFISILADGSTDVGNTEQEIIYITMLQNGKPVTQYVEIKSVRNANAANIAKALKDTLEKKLKLKNWPDNVMACCFDGAAVMMGHVSGVATNLAQDAPHLISIHCCAHRLELAIKDAMKENVEIELDDILKDTYKNYKKSRTNWDDLREAGDSLGKKVKRPVRHSGTRWLAHHHRALASLDNNWSSMVTQLEDQSVQGSTKDKREKAESLLHRLKAVTFVYFLNFFLCYLGIVKQLSLMLQKNDITVDTVSDKIHAVSTRLKGLGKRLEEELTKDVEDMEEGNIKFRGEVIGTVSAQTRETRNQEATPSTESIKEKVKRTATQIIDDTLKHINDRFESLEKNKIIQAAGIVNTQNWPSGGEALAVYGDEEVEVLFNHFEGPLKKRHVDINSTKVQWSELKVFVTRHMQLEKTAKKKEQKSSKKGKHSKQRETIWEKIMTDPDLCERFNHILPLIKIILIIPVHTSNLERGFSQMNNMKTDKRNKLTTCSLNSLLTVKLSGIDFKEYDPTNAILSWSQFKQESDGKPGNLKRSRRLNRKPRGPSKKKKLTTMVDDRSTEVTEEIEHSSDFYANSESDVESVTVSDSDYDVPQGHGHGGVAALAKELNFELESDSDSDSIAWSHSEDSESEESESDPEDTQAQPQDSEDKEEEEDSEDKEEEDSDDEEEEEDN